MAERATITLGGNCGGPAPLMEDRLILNSSRCFLFSILPATDNRRPRFPIYRRCCGTLFTHDL